MKTIKLMLICLLLWSCEERKAARYVCNCEQSKTVSSFVEKSIAPANNMSDEEMEDVIRELFETGVKINCSQRVFVIDNNGYINRDVAVIGECETAYDYIY